MTAAWVRRKNEKPFRLGCRLVAGRGRFSLWPMIVMGLVSLVDQVDQSILRGALPFVEREFRLSGLSAGLLGSAFIVVSVFATIPAGWIADHYRRTRVIGWTLASWSVLILLSATAVNYLNLLFARMVMGIGQSVDDPASTSLLADYYPARMRAKVFSFTQVSFFLGTGIGIALGGLVAEALSWRWAFALVGVPGSLVALAVFRLREPRRGESDLPEDLSVEDIERMPPEKSRIPTTAELGFVPFLRLAFTQLRTEVAMIFRIRTMRYILVGVAALLFTVSGIGFWLTTYHVEYSGMTETQAAAFAGLVLGAGGIGGTFLGGWLSDRYQNRWKGGRIVIVVWSAIACAALFAVSFAVGEVSVRLLLQFVGVAAAAGAAPGLRAAMTDVVPAESRGVGASAFALTVGIFGPALAPALVGFLRDLTSLVAAFYIVFPPVVLGLLLLLRARHTIEEDARAIVAAMIEEQEVLEREKAHLAHADSDAG
ncbi:MAG: MFS transporter [Acidimicrobiales bacterium]|nr:MAG: MFS transporter [Acidimicrobiales bacterium]